jgi:anaerobic selenocysteine-containing dehydrogenase/Fe-S-cluster-containing dehydrogenase component
MPELDRRDFLKLVGAGAGAAATTACSDPVEKLVPYVIQPESVTPGIAVEYASTCTECPVGCGIHVRTREGRPIKVEGNPDHPINRGKLCARGQVGLGRTYHPDRYDGPLARSGSGSLESLSWDDAKAKLAGKLKSSGGKTWILGGPVGPTLSSVIDEFSAAAGVAGRLVHQPFADLALQAAARAVFGVASTPIFDVGKADLVVDLGSDFLDTGLSPTEHSRQFADARDAEKTENAGLRLVSVGPRMNLTTASADAWIEAKAGSEGYVALALAKAVYDKKGAPTGADAGTVSKLLAGADLGSAASRAGVDKSKLEDLVDRLLHAKSALVLPPGIGASTSAATATAAVVLLINAMLGATGGRMVIPPASGAPAPASIADVKKLIAAMNAGKVSVLLIHDSNPVYSLPASLGFAEALKKVDTVVSFAPLKDETSESAALILPDHTAFESWGDLAPRPGVRSLIQPTVRPLKDTQALGDTLMDLGRALGGKMSSGSFRNVLEGAWGDSDFADALGKGGHFGALSSAVTDASGGLGGLSFAAPALAGSGDYTLIAHPHSFYGDGSGATLPWLQETPDPVTKLSWGSWAEMSFETAEKLGVVFGDVVKLDSGAGSIELSAFPRGGIRHDVIAVAIGQGHTVGHYASREGDGEPGAARGANVLSLLPDVTDEVGGLAFLSTKVSATKTGRFQRMALSQWTDNQRGRDLAPQISLAKLLGRDDGHLDEGGHGAHHDEPPHTFDPAYDANPDQPYRWGMTIDNDRCNGCSACVTACAVENNVAVVGEQQAIMHREMSWIRIERYNGDGDREGGGERRPTPDREVLGEVDVRHLPMPCQHCGAAPCESVCPVIATYHTEEGINGMVYNRCVGTRYCANNCVYKVRRFNYWDYGNKNFPGMLGMMLNPDVTVRQQGVMEKCSFCVQRIEEARQPAKDEGREVQDGEVLTACQQTCPSNAISFGNLRDEGGEARVRSQNEKRAFHALQELNTRPAITYLAQVTREDHEGSH